MMGKYSQMIILVIVCLLPAACFRHQSDGTGVKQERADRKAALTGASDDSGKASQPETTKGQPRGTGAVTYDLPGYSFLVPDEWEVVPPERFLDVPDRWEPLVPTQFSHVLYMASAKQNHQKARFCVNDRLRP
jgi:hypothetical protein